MAYKDEYHPLLGHSVLQTQFLVFGFHKIRS